MRKPNKTYRFLGGARSPFGRAFRVAQSPLRSLRQSFGHDDVARDVAENIPLAACRRGFQLVMATVKVWGARYQGPKLSFIFRSLSRKQRSLPMVAEAEPN